MIINTPINNNELLPLPEENIYGGIVKCNEINNFNRTLTPITLQPQNTTPDDLELHMIYRQRLTRQYTQVLLRTLDRMKTHVIPFDLYQPDYNQFIRHMDYRETIEEAHSSTLKLEWQAVRHLLSAYGLPEWSYKPPDMPPAKPTFLPLPDQAHDIIHQRYDHDEYKNALTQYFLMHSYMIGMRAPSELVSLRLSDIDLENSIMVITEKKKHNRQRMLALPETLMNSRWTKSLRNWIDIWRPKAENQYSGDALYLRPDGHPIKEMQVTNHILRRVQPQHPGYHLYISRHWCATALLIKEYLSTGYWNVYAVKSRLGHEREATTYNYVRYAEQYVKVAPYDWFSRILRNTVDDPEKDKSTSILSIGLEKTERKQTHQRIRNSLAVFILGGISVLSSILFLFFSFFAGVVQTEERPTCNGKITGSNPVVGSCNCLDDGTGGGCRRVDQGVMSEPCLSRIWQSLALRSSAPDIIQGQIHASFHRKHCTNAGTKGNIFCSSFIIYFLPRFFVEYHPSPCRVHPQTYNRVHHPECGVTSYSRTQACQPGFNGPDTGIKKRTKKEN